MQRPIVSLISNCLSEDNRAFLRQRNGFLTPGVINPFEFSYKDKQGIIPIIDIIPSDIFSSSGMKKAKGFFIDAVKYSIYSGAKVILLAASTKRLFGDGLELKAMFPNIVFTIGDNGTALAFLKQIDSIVWNYSLDSPIVVLGAGFLGETAINYLKAKGFERIIIISHHKIKGIELKYQYQSLDEYIHSKDFVGAVLLLGCAHNYDIKPNQLQDLMQEKIIILDVAVPKAIPYSTISSLNGKIIRFDGGDFEIRNLKLSFPHNLAGLNFESEFYGCYTEALLLALSNYNGVCDFFQVTENNMKVIQSLMKNFNTDFFISMKNFGQPVEGFDSILKL